MKFSVQTAVLPELSREQVVAALSRHGYDAVEWRLHETYHVDPAGLPGSARTLGKLCADHGLAISCLMGYAPLDDLDQQKRIAEACAIVGCPRYRPSAVIYDGTRAYPELYAETVERLGRVLDAVAPFGAKPVIETHFSTIAPSASLAHRLVSNFPPERIGVNFDPANCIIEGHEAWQMGLELLGPYLDYVHAKNASWIKENGRWRWVFDDLRNGRVDWREVMTALKRVGFDGCVSNENFFAVPMKTRGFVGEDLTVHLDRYRDIDERLAGDLAYLERCLDDSPAR